MAGDLAGTNSNLKLTSIENLEIINANVTRALNLVGENFKGLESIELKGDATTLNVSDFTYGVKIDATENADNIFGGFKADTINGGAGNDTIQGNQGDDVLTGGNGADTFIIGNAKDFGVDQILDFSAEDKISMDGFSVKELKKFDASTFSTVTYKTLDSVLATFIQGGANETKAGDIAIFTYDGKTYALLAKGAFDVLNDALIDITGTNVASLTESNFGEAVSQYIYNDYAAFTTNAATPGAIPNGEAIIKTMTTAEAGTLLGQDAGYLALVSEGGIKKITGKDPIAVAVPVDGGIGEFDAKIFDSKLGADVVDVTLNINGSANSDIIYASKLGGTITAGSGVDKITLNAGADVVDFSSTTAAENANNVIGFDVAKDKLQFDATTFSLIADNAVRIVKIAGEVQDAKGQIFVSSKTNIDSLNTSSNTNKVNIAIATDTGDIIYDADGNFTSGSIVIGNIGSAAATNLTADNFVVV